MVSCTDHEVIPPPVPLVDLECLCEGSIQQMGGTDSSITYNDTCTFSSSKTINTGSLSQAEYQTQIRNAIGATDYWEVEMRSIYWNDDGSNNPSSTDWQAYFNGNMSPNYAPSTTQDGIVLRYHDVHGRTWTSDTNQVCLQNVTYNLFSYDSDTTGEYMEFDLVMNGTMKNSDITPDSTRCFSNIHIKSAYRRE